MKRVSYFLIILIPTLWSCDEKEQAPDPLLEHWPLELSNAWEYQVVETYYSSGVPNILEYRILDSLINIETPDFGTRTYEFGRYFWDGSLNRWLLQEYWTLNKVYKKVLVDRANVPRVYFEYPPYEGRTWDANVYNSLDEDVYIMRGVGINHTVDGVEYGGTVEVVHNDNEDLIVNHVQESQYFAKDVGMIEHLKLSYIYCQDPGCLGNEEVVSGYDIRWSLIRKRLN